MKKYIFLVVISLILANSFIYLTTEYSPIADKYRYSTIKLGGDLNENFGEITPELVIDQSFVANSNNMSGVNMFFSTFNRVNNGKTIIRILDVTKSNVLRTVTLNNAVIHDNEYTNIIFDPIHGTKDNVYFLSISADISTKVGNGITIWRDDNQSKNTSLSVNNEDVEGTIVVEMIYENKIDTFPRLILNLVVLLLNFLTLSLFRFLKKR